MRGSPHLEREARLLGINRQFAELFNILLNALELCPTVQRELPNLMRTANILTHSMEAALSFQGKN